jgi:PAS domain S-box-containing protein
VADERPLLESLLEYTIAVLEADHATFCEVQNSPEVITVLAAAGSLDHPEVLPGLGDLASDALGYDGPEEDAGANVSVYRRGDPDTPGVTAFLERIGAAFDVTIRVFQDDVRTHLLEVYFMRDAPFGAAEVAKAEQLADLLTTVISRDRLMQQLEQAETRFRTLVQQIPAIPYIVDEGYQVVFLAPRLNQLLGYPDDHESSFDDWQDAVHEDDRERAVAMYAKHLATGAPYDEVYRLIGRDGAVYWFHDRATLLRGSGGAPTLSHGVMFDVTERRRTEQALRRSEAARQEVLEAMLHAEAAARAQIAGELHDDTIQVMTAALMAVERVTIAAAGADRRVADALEDARATLRTAVERARRLTFELRPPLLDAQGIGAALRDLADEVGQEGGFAVALAAPDGRFTYLVEDLAFRTVKEALVNARKHSQASRVEVRLWSDEAWLRGCVADDGRGFDVTRALDRSGMRLHLGLDAMRERLRLAGGDVSISSALGKGARVDFAIPLGPSQA